MNSSPVGPDVGKAWSRRKLMAESASSPIRMAKSGRLFHDKYYLGLPELVIGSDSQSIY